MVTSNLLAPSPPAACLNAEAAERGRAIFGQTCSACHVGTTGTDNNSGKLHAQAETGIDRTYGARTASPLNIPINGNTGALARYFVERGSSIFRSDGC